MSQEQFLAIMPFISGDLMKMIMVKQNLSEKEAVTKLYGSRLYKALEVEETKVWQYSTEMLYSLFEEECKTGEFVYPDV